MQSVLKRHTLRHFLVHCFNSLVKFCATDTTIPLVFCILLQIDNMIHRLMIVLKLMNYFRIAQHDTIVIEGKRKQGILRHYKMLCGELPNHAGIMWLIKFYTNLPCQLTCMLTWKKMRDIPNTKLFWNSIFLWSNFFLLVVFWPAVSDFWTLLYIKPKILALLYFSHSIYDLGHWAVHSPWWTTPFRPWIMGSTAGLSFPPTWETKRYRKHQIISIIIIHRKHHFIPKGPAHNYFINQSFFYMLWPFIHRQTAFVVTEDRSFGKLLQGW